MYYIVYTLIYMYSDLYATRFIMINKKKTSELFILFELVKDNISLALNFISHKYLYLYKIIYNIFFVLKYKL